MNTKYELQPFLSVQVDPAEMLHYVHTVMSAPATGAPEDRVTQFAERQWGADTAVARAAQLRWSALNRAFGDARVTSWTGRRKPDQIHVPAALIAAAGVARLTVAADQIVFDIPTLLDATLQLCEPAGHA
jgi:hypothetical protein